MIPDSPPTWAQTSTTTLPLVATRVNEEYTSSATSIYSNLKSKDWQTAINKDEASTRAILTCYFFVSFFIQDFYFVWLHKYNKPGRLFLYSIAPDEGYIQYFHIYGIYLVDAKQYSGTEKTIWYPSLRDYLHPFSVGRWKRRVLWGKRWIEKLFVSRQSQHSDLYIVFYESISPYLYLDLACKQICPPQKIKGLKRRIESTKD